MTKKPVRLERFRNAVRDRGIAYGSARDAHFRGEFPVVKIGKNDTHQAWYVDPDDLDAWIASQKESVAS